MSGVLASKEEWTPDEDPTSPVTKNPAKQVGTDVAD